MFRIVPEIVESDITVVGGGLGVDEFLCMQAA